MAVGAAAVGLAAGPVLDLDPPPRVPGSLEAWLGPAVSRPFDGRAYVQLAFWSWAPLVTASWAVNASSAAATVTRNETVPLIRRIFEGAIRLATVAALVLAVTSPFGLLSHVAPGRLIFAPLALVPLTLACAGLGFVVAVLTRRRGLTILIVGAETVLVFLMNVMADIDGSLDGLRYLSPFHYADVKTVYLDGVVVWHAGLLLLAFVAQIALGLAIRARQDAHQRAPGAR